MNFQHLIRSFIGSFGPAELAVRQAIIYNECTAGFSMQLFVHRNERGVNSYTDCQQPFSAVFFYSENTLWRAYEHRAFDIGAEPITDPTGKVRKQDTQNI